MRIFVVEPLGQGGLIHYSYHMCRALQRAGADVTLITSTEYELENLDHEFTVLRYMRLWNARQKSSLKGIFRLAQRGIRGIRYVIDWWRLVQLLKRERPDIILFGEIRFSFERYFLSMLRNDNLKLADIVHDVEAYDTSKQSEQILKEDETHRQQYNAIYNLFDVLFVHDRINRERFLELYDVPPKRVIEIPHGSNEIMLEMTPSHTSQQLRERYGIADGQKVVLFFGTLNKYKGVEDLLSAFPKVAQATNAMLVIAGYPAKDVDPDMLRSQVADTGIQANVAWHLDYIANEEVVPLMTMADVIALPYRAITQSGVLQIAYACSTPVVATRVGGLVDAVEHERSGLLVEPQNQDALANALITILDNDTMRHNMADYASELAKTRYSWQAVGQRVLSAMEQSL